MGGAEGGVEVGQERVAQAQNFPADLAGERQREALGRLWVGQKAYHRAGNQSIGGAHALASPRTSVTLGQRYSS